MARAWHHLPVSALAVLWNLLLVGDYLGLRLQVPLYVSWMTPEQLGWFQAMPIWQSVAWAIAVWSGMLAAVLLVSRMATGVFFALSFVGWVVTAAGFLLFRNPPVSAITGQAGLWLLALAVAASFLLFLYARWMHKRVRHAG